MAKKMFRKRGARKGGRRLQPSGFEGDFTLGQPLRNVARAGIKGAKGVGKRAAARFRGGRKRVTKAFAQRNFNARIQQSDNITTAPAFKIGVPRPISFEEKVSRITHPPVIVKRQFTWSAECPSGRKSFFGIPLNSLSQSDNGGTLYVDAVTNYTGLGTNTSLPDPTLITAGIINNQQKVYIDYLSEKLQMVNSGSNSMKGKVTLYGYKRDCPFSYGNANLPMTPINVMMYASTSGLVQSNTGQEATVGNGWAFDAVSGASLGLNYTQNYNCPGSSMNPSTACAHTDLALDVLNSHISDFTGHFFTKVKEFDFALKPGQQIDHYTIMNNLPVLRRPSVTETFLKGITYYLVVQFQAGIVGDATVTTGDNVISTGSAQLSCILEEKRVLGTLGKNKAQVVMRTAPLTAILKASQYIINPDTGVADTGYDDDA